MNQKSMLYLMEDGSFEGRELRWERELRSRLEVAHEVLCDLVPLPLATQDLVPLPLATQTLETNARCSSLCALETS
jgi:hypothetical protein